MAEILVKAQDATHANSDKDRRGCYKRGDPVVVKPDGWEWGKLEGPPGFVVIRVLNLSVEEASEALLSSNDQRRTTTLDLSRVPGLRRSQYRDLTIGQYRALVAQKNVGR